MTAYSGNSIGYPAFPEFGSSDPNIILQCNCRSLAAVTASGGTEVTTSGTNTYNDGGVLLTATSGIKWTGLTTAQKNALVLGGTLTCWIEKGYIDGTRTAPNHEYSIGMYDAVLGKYHSITRFSGDVTLELFLNSSLSSTSTDHTIATTTGKDNYVRLDFTSHGPLGKPTIYVDYFPFTQHSSGIWPKTSDPFANIMLGGKPTAPTGPASHRIKDFMVSTRPIGPFPTNYSIPSLFIGGHSYMAQGDYSTNLGLYRATAGSGSLDTGRDASATSTIHRELARRGIGIGTNRIRNHAYGGASVRSATGGMAYQTTAYKTNFSRFSKVILMWGANECSGTSGTWSGEYGASGSIEDWETNIKTLINTMITAGADTFLMLNQPYFSSQHATASGQQYRDKVDGLNTSINNVISYINTSTVADAYLIDVWSAMGGTSSSNTSWWGGFTGTDQAHPNLATSKMLGKLCADKLYTLL